MSDEPQGKVIPVPIEDEIRSSYLNYAMSVIVSRALPDVRDGLKPVHRRILYSMSEMGLQYDRPYKKCGRIVGDVLGKFHPHGDQSIYDALVRMAQDFSLRYPVVWGQGNFGSVDGDPPAAMRYTESRLHRIAGEMLKDINKETVDFVPNYDDTMEEPAVLPAAFPFLLTNGASGIAVGMATNIPPHNLREVCAAIVRQIEEPDISLDELCTIVTGPDFPTGGVIFGGGEIREAYKTGKGKITVRCRFALETTKAGKERIIVTEIPYGVNKALLITRIAELVRDRKIDGIADLNDESDRQGMRIVIELKKGAIPKVVLNQLFTQTPLQQNFNVNSLALVKGRPKLLTLWDAIHYFIEHRKEVVTRRTRFELKKAEERAHVLEGLRIALDNIDEVIRIIRSSKTVEVARVGLMERLRLSEIQAQAVLDMRLQRLTNLETQKLLDELKEVLAQIAYLRGLLADERKILAVVKSETEEIASVHGDDRRTEIVSGEVEEINIEDLIKQEDMVVLISNRGYIKRVPVTSYRNQSRGGRGSSSTTLVEEDFVVQLFVASTHDVLLYVSSAGKAYWQKVHEIPEAGRTARGQHIKSLLALSANEEITAVVALREFSKQSFVFMATARGVVKKAETAAFANARTRGINAIGLDEGDRLVTALLTDGASELVLVSEMGSALRFSEGKVRPMGRASRGVQGIRLGAEDRLAGALTVRADEQMLVVSEFGYGKRVQFDHFSAHGRGTGGQQIYKAGEKTGKLVAVVTVKLEDELVCMTSIGNAIKLKVEEVPVQGKAAQGVRLVHIERPDAVVGVARVVKE